MLTGNIKKMRSTLNTPVEYVLPVGDSLLLPVNPLLGQTLVLRYHGDIHCVACGRKTGKSFQQGYCYPCSRRLARCDLCMVRPEKCHYALGTCREPEWGEAHCMQIHKVYLANTSGIKVGITRESQVPVRWIDQGASQALPVFNVKNRYQSGLLEVIFKAHVADRTDWRKLLKGRPEPADLECRRDELLSLCAKEIDGITARFEPDAMVEAQAAVLTLAYPVIEYPGKIVSLNFDKMPIIQGTLLGIKGQYLILDNGVLNIRKFGGYKISITAPGLS
ncbi:MAG: DUF2797 domain-containing protein [Gammaproteobacteria bacterium]|nr:DUF2797 domain-containing protein [Gammaproteobacteria bacterium]